LQLARIKECALIAIMPLNLPRTSHWRAGRDLLCLAPVVLFYYRGNMCYFNLCVTDNE